MSVYEVLNEDYLSEWLVNEKVLSLAIEGNIDQAQYCNKIKCIIEFIGDRKSEYKIRVLWSIQFNTSMTFYRLIRTSLGQRQKALRTF